MKLVMDKLFMYLLILSGLYLLQYYTIGKLHFLEQATIADTFYLKDILFLLVSAIFIKIFIHISPQQKG